MTKEELKKEATAYALEWGDKTDGTYACCRDGYLAGAEPREKQIAELEKAECETQELLDKQIEATYKVVEKLNNAKELLEFWVNDFYDNSKHPNRYKERSKAIIETEAFLKEVER